MSHLTEKLLEVGLKNLVVGAIKREHYKKLEKKYHFDSWHTSPYELREYLQATANYINQHDAKTVVDIGCGLGELLRHINAPNKYGYDLAEEVIEAAKSLGDHTIAYRVGSFLEIEVMAPVDYAVTLGFMHGSREDTWHTAYHELSERCDIRHFIVDTVPEGYNGAHLLDFRLILPKEYVLVDRLGPYLCGRYLEVYEKR